MSQATYLALLDDMYALTGRPDLLAESALALRKATMKFHLADLWKNDITFALITVPVLDSSAESFRYTLDLTVSATYPLVRKVASISEYNVTPTGYELQFTELDQDRIMDSYAIEMVNYWYQAGRQVSLRANKLLTTLRVNYYRFPDVAPTVYDSWIAEQFKDNIVVEAAATVFATIGKDAEAARYAGMFQESLQLLRMSEI